MRLFRALLAVPIALSLLAFIPSAAATAPVHGTVTKCSSAPVCNFVFNTTAGAGWANTTINSLGKKTMSLQLPGESRASYNLSYSTYTARLTGYYTYWTVGNFLGTDANTGKVVLGTTNTNFTITAHCQRGCYYTYTTDNGTIGVKFTNAEITSTAISCVPSSIKVTQKTSCTATVTDGWNASNVPTGNMRISVGGLGTLSNKGSCALTNGTCSFTFHPFDNTCGSVLITAKYLGTSAFYRSSGSTNVYVTTAC